MTSNVTVTTGNAVTNISVSTGGGNRFLTVATDSNSAVADNTTDTITITGAGGITTSAVAGTDTVTITQGAPDISSNSIGDVSDVDITTSAPTTNQILLWNSTSNKFVPGDVSSGAGYQTVDTITDLTDHSSAGAYSEGQVFVFDASYPTQFVNRNLSGAITLDGDGVTAINSNQVGTTQLDLDNIDISDFSNITANVNVLNDSYLFNQHGNIGVGFFDDRLQLSKTELAGDLTMSGSSIDIGSSGVRVDNIFVNNLNASGTITGIDISDLTDTGGLLQADDLSNNTTDDLAEGSTNLYFSGKTTDNLPEGSTNLYYADSLVDAHLTGGTGVTYTTGTIAIGQDVGTTADVTFNTVEATDELIGTMRGEMVFNAQAAVALTKGEAVYVSGLSGNTPIVNKARANSGSTMPAFGIAAENISSGGTGKITTFGSQTGLNVADFGQTSITFGLGDTVYISATEAGKLTNVAPTGESNLIQNIGKIERATPTTNMTIKVGGAGRTNATPALDSGNIFIGNASNQAVTTTLNTEIDNRVANTSITALSDVDTTGVTTNSILKYNGANWVVGTDVDTGLLNVVEDTTPQLGGSLDVNGNKIVSVSNGNIDIEPNGTGDVLLGNFVFDADQTVGAGQDNYVLTYDNTSGKISLEASSGGVSDIVDDTTPQLGGDLDVNGNNIVSVSAGNVIIAPDSANSEGYSTATLDSSSGHFFLKSGLVLDHPGTAGLEAKYSNYITVNTTDGDLNMSANGGGRIRPRSDFQIRGSDGCDLWLRSDNSTQAKISYRGGSTEQGKLAVDSDNSLVTYYTDTWGQTMESNSGEVKLQSNNSNIRATAQDIILQANDDIDIRAADRFQFRNKDSGTSEYNETMTLFQGTTGYTGTNATGAVVESSSGKQSGDYDTSLVIRKFDEGDGGSTAHSGVQQRIAQYELTLEAGKSTLALNYRDDDNTGAANNTATLFKFKNSTSETATAATQNAPDVMQLGVDLDVNGNDIIATGTGSVKIGDGANRYAAVDLNSDKLVLGNIGIDMVDENITTSITNGDIKLRPNGTGGVRIGDTDTDVVLKTNGSGALTIQTSSGNKNITIDPNGTGTSYVRAMRVNSSSFFDMPQFRRQGTSQGDYNLEVSNDSTSTAITAGQPGGCFGFSHYSNGYTNPNYAGYDAYYVGSINAIVGDEGTFGSAGENNNAIRLYTYVDQYGFGLNNVGEFRYASASLMKETLKFDNTSNVITIEAATANDDLTLKTSGSGDINVNPSGTGYIILNNLPTSSAGLPTGAVWNDSGTLKIA